jgi:hypothetical protein
MHILDESPYGPVSLQTLQFIASSPHMTLHQFRKIVKNLNKNKNSQFFNLRLLQFNGSPSATLHHLFLLR